MAQFCKPTNTKVYFSESDTLTQQTALVTSRQGTNPYEMDQRKAIACSSTILQNPNLLACQRIMCLCPQCDTEELEIRHKWSAADSDHFRSLGADSVGGKCDWEKA